jgi:hypothetical protein
MGNEARNTTVPSGYRIWILDSGFWVLDFEFFRDRGDVPHRYRRQHGVSQGYSF